MRRSWMTAAVVAAVMAISNLVPATSAQAVPSGLPENEVACKLATTNPDYMSWWKDIYQRTEYSLMFWDDIVPHPEKGACYANVNSAFWNQAVPDNWVSVANIGGWLWTSGGYFTQSLWLRAVPDAWAGGYYRQTFWQTAVPNGWAVRNKITGWPTATGGYYQMYLWMQAAPNNWASRPNIGGWPWGSGGYYTQTLWLDAIPNGWATRPNIGGWFADTGGYYQQTFWLKAIPDNWMTRGNIGGWPWSSGGYYTQFTWINAIPEEWAVVNNIGGWPEDTGGYYTQAFWLQMVPKAVATRSNIGGWPSATGGYYEMFLWMQAAPNNWAEIESIMDWPWLTGGYYTMTLWLRATPGKWAPVPNIGGWIDPAGGSYYEQNFWLRAVPQAWVSRAGQAVDGANTGWYRYWFYRLALWSGGFAERPGETDFTLDGVTTSNYYTYWFNQPAIETMPTYAFLQQLAGKKYLTAAANSGFKPVNEWFDSNAKAVVIFSFDVEGTVDNSCKMRDVLNNKGVTATFFAVGAQTDALAPCISGFDVQNHTFTHPPLESLLETPGPMDSQINADQNYQINAQNTKIFNKFGVRATGFRTPWAESAFDASVLRNVASTGLRADSSIPQVSNYVSTHFDEFDRLAPQERGYALTNFPSPFLAETVNGAKMVEFPYTYPMDYAAQGMEDLGYEAWTKIFDEIYAQRGTMVILMHPWLMPAKKRTIVRDLIDYMRTKPDVRFSNIRTAKNRAAATYGWN